jgi:ATP-dependent DNA helicase DinG
MPKRLEKSAPAKRALPPERIYVPDPEAFDPSAAVARGRAELAAPAARHQVGTPPRQDSSPSVAEIFGPGGLLEKCMPQGYEHRPSQLEMAQLLEQAFATGQHAIVEAGTGTGKTLAYLIPAIRSGCRVVISTATKSLQEQLFNKDIPFLQRHFAPELSVAVMKGRNNFLCRQKCYWTAAQPALHGLDELEWFARIAEWEKLTETGDRAELSFLPDDAELWHRLDARREMCTGTRCAEFERCFVTAMHQRAAKSDIVIVNHHLFFADLALRGDDFAGILPDYDAVIFDEAHEIEDVAGNYFGREISNYRLEELARDAEQVLRMTPQGAAPLLRRITRLQERSRVFFEAFPARPGRSPFERAEREQFLERNGEAYEELLRALKALETEIAGQPSKSDDLVNIARRSFELRGEMEFLLQSAERNYVYWMERRGKGVFLAATPIDVSGILQQHLFERFRTVILTSATLAVGGRFEFLKQRLGLAAALERVLPTEFDYRNQALLYVPSKMPDVRDANFTARAAEEIARLLRITRGRAFCLFTSHNQMNEIFGRVKPLVDFPLLLQGTAPRAALLERFRRTPHAVLFATASFWQGVDVPGEQLSCVIVDRLPFAVPSDPVVAARVRALAEQGRNAFGEYQIPEAVLALKQGFGRLIRTREDRGVLAILDNRIERMWYGKIFVDSLPKYARTREIAEIEQFLGRKQ